MRFSTIFTAALLTATTFVVSPVLAATGHLCLDVRKIDNTESKDGKILTFHMHDGTVLQNHLKQQCDGLIFGGFVWGVEGSDNQVCEDTQTLRTLQTNELCVLGKFDPVKMAPKG
jgi:hypothetical protein